VFLRAFISVETVKLKITKRTHLPFSDLPANKANPHAPVAKRKKTNPFSNRGLWTADADARQRPGPPLTCATGNE
jgi:hypothetical protein